MKYNIDTKGLKSYLEGLKYADFQNPSGLGMAKRDNLDGIIKEGFSRADFDKGFYKNVTIPQEQIIEYGMPFLVDALGNDLTILIHSRRKYKLPDGRVVQSKYHSTIIKDCRGLYGSVLNGYWMIPPQFISKIK